MLELLSKVKKDASIKLGFFFVKFLPKEIYELDYFDFWESQGLHVTPVHYYTPIPDTRYLKGKSGKNISNLVGVDMNSKKQLGFINDVFPKYQQEYNFPDTKTDKPFEFYSQNGTFLTYDAEVLHSMIRHYKPQRIIEVGSGQTTYISARACLLNKEKDDINTRLSAIEPYPNNTLKNGFPGLYELIPKKIEDINLNYFSQLKANDILFIDSSHVIKTGGDVNYLYLEIIPRLQPGVIIHAHDIFLPSEYPERWIFQDRYFWTEQYLLHALLLFNDQFEVLWASHYMHLRFNKELHKLFPKYPDMRYPDLGPSSFWIRKKNEHEILNKSI